MQLIQPVSAVCGPGNRRSRQGRLIRPRAQPGSAALRSGLSPLRETCRSRVRHHLPVRRSIPRGDRLRQESELMTSPCMSIRCVGASERHRSSGSSGAASSVKSAPALSPHQGSFTVRTVDDLPIGTGGGTPVGVPAVDLARHECERSIREDFTCKAHNINRNKHAPSGQRMSSRSSSASSTPTSVPPSRGCSTV